MPGGGAVETALSLHLEDPRKMKGKEGLSAKRPEGFGSRICQYRSKSFVETTANPHEQRKGEVNAQGIL